MTAVPRLVRMLLGWMGRRPAPDLPPAGPAPSAPVPDEVVSDEKARIEDLRTVAKWQLAALGAVAAAAFAGVALNRLPNPADPAGGGWGALWVAALGATVTLSSIVLMITLVGWVLAPQFRSLEDQRKRRRGGWQPWYDQSVFYLPDVGIHTLDEFLKRQGEVYAACTLLTKKAVPSPRETARLDELREQLTSYFGPVNLRLHWRNRREIVARRARIALVGLGALGFSGTLGAMLYLGAVAYHRPGAAQTLGLPAYGLWRPLTTPEPRLTAKALAAELGKGCSLVNPTAAAAGVQVLVLRETPADSTFQVLVAAAGCAPRLYTVPQDEVTASAPFELPPP